MNRSRLSIGLVVVVALALLWIGVQRDLKTALDAAVAFGTLAVAVLAIWGDRIKSWATPPEAIIEAHNLEGDSTGALPEGASGPTARVMYYHLKVVNKTPWFALSQCRVLLTGLARRDPDGQFRTIHMPVPFPFKWAPAEISEERATVTKDRIFDFGRCFEGGGGFHPVLHAYPINFQGELRAGAMRYYLEIDATNFSSSRPQVFEVEWDGQWHPEREQMKHHLRIRENTG